MESSSPEYAGCSGAPVASQGLFLAVEEVCLLTEQSRQELQLFHCVRGQFSGPGTAGDLPDIGADVVDAGVGVQSESGQLYPDGFSSDQLAEVGVTSRPVRARYRHSRWCCSSVMRMEMLPLLSRTRIALPPQFPELLHRLGQPVHSEA